MHPTKFDYIKQHLMAIHSQVSIDKNFNLTDINIKAEDFFMHILNSVYGWRLINANKIQENFPAIDLIDTNSEIVIQVTSDITTTKINTTLEKFEQLENYKHYDLKFCYIVEKADITNSFLAKKGIVRENIYDITRILKDI